MDEREQERRRRLAVLIVALPILAGVTIAALVYFFGTEHIEVRTPKGEERIEHHLVEAAAPAEAGTPAPRVRLAEGATGRSFDSASLGSEPYAVVFLSTRCEAIGRFLGRVAGTLGPGEGTVLAISADPRTDSKRAVRAFTSRNHLRPGGPVKFLVGSEAELRGYWNAWGFNGPQPRCNESIPAHLVAGTDVDTGILDISGDSPTTLLTGPLRGAGR